MKLKERVKRIFSPPPGTARWLVVLPYVVLGVVVILILTGGTYAWDYTNSPQFCGTTCHTMPPQDATYKISPHANVYCTECHIGRAFVGQQLRARPKMFMSYIPWSSMFMSFLSVLHARNQTS